MILLSKILRLSNLSFKNRFILSTTRIIFKDIAQSPQYKPIQKVQDFLNGQHIKY